MQRRSLLNLLGLLRCESGRIGSGRERDMPYTSIRCEILAAGTCE